MNWYKFAQNDQLSFPFRDPRMEQDVRQLAWENIPLHQRMIESMQGEPIERVIEDLMPEGNEQDLVFLLNIAKLPWQKITFQTGADPIYVVHGKKSFVIEDLQSVKDASQWVYDIQDPEQYIEFPEESFWDSVPENGFKVYHGTSEERLADIMKYGLEARSETRGISNRSMSDAVFTSSEPDTAAYYYDRVIEIDVSAMKRDGYTPRAGGETPLEEAEQYQALSHYIGLEDFEYEGYGSDGLSEDTIAFYGAIPAKYLKVVK
jgi:hypothetical protein